MYRKLANSRGSVLGYHLSGTLTPGEVREMQREMYTVIQDAGKVRLLIEIGDLSLPESQAVWQDLQFARYYLKDVERFAIVGEAKWQEWVTRLTDVLSQGEARYFDSPQLEEAWEWIQQE